MVFIWRYVYAYLQSTGIRRLQAHTILFHDVTAFYSSRFLSFFYKRNVIPELTFWCSGILFDSNTYVSLLSNYFNFSQLFSFFLNKFPDKHVHVVGNYTNYSTSMECFHWMMEENLLSLLFHRMNINFGWLFFLYVHIVCNLMKTKQQHVHKLGKKGYKFELCAK